MSILFAFGSFHAHLKITFSSASIFLLAALHNYNRRSFITSIHNGVFSVASVTQQHSKNAETH